MNDISRRNAMRPNRAWTKPMYALLAILGAPSALGFTASADAASEACVSASVGGGCAAPSTESASFPVSTDGTDPRGWNPRQDALTAAPAAHRVVFENENIRVVRVTVPARAQLPPHHHALPAIVVMEPTTPRMNLLQRDAKGNPVDFGFVDALQSPQVGLQPPQAARSISNGSSIDAHFIRIEFKQGVPKLLHPEWTADRMPISTDGSDPKSWDPGKEALTAAPGNHRLIFEDAVLRMQSVSVPAMSEEPYHDHPYPSVLVVDQAPREVDRNRSGAEFDLSSFAKLAPYVFVQPPEGLHSVKNLDVKADHLIRIEFKGGLPVPSATGVR